MDGFLTAQGRAELDAFHRARGEMTQALLAWLRTGPGRDLARQEIDATLSAVRQLAELEGRPDGR